jgi:uncharacterized membrane protein YoaK (UPF0700 family)
LDRAGQGQWRRRRSSAAALGGFAVGVAAGLPLLHHHSPLWPSLARPALALELAALGGVLAVWLAVGAHTLRYGLIRLAGIAMGVQSAAVRASDLRGVNTTYMTSTFQNAIAGLVQRLRRSEHHRGQGPSLPGAAWLTYALGAVGGAFAEMAWHAGAAAIPLAIVLVVTILACRGRPNPTQEQ